MEWTDFISDTEVYDHRLYLPRAEVSETETPSGPAVLGAPPALTADDETS